MLPSRSKLAFDWTLDCLARHAEDNRQKLYFWTFTFVQKMPDAFYSYRWKGFIRDVLHLFDGQHPLYGLKVAEPHKRAMPGSPWKGIHYHCLVNHRIPVGEVRRIGKRYGIGRVEVKSISDVAGAKRYLGKYLGKEFADTKLAPGIRRWSTIGGFNGVTVRKVRVNTPTSRACAEFKKVLGRPLHFSEVSEICRSKNIIDPLHLKYSLWRAAQPETGPDKLESLRWPWWYLDREIGLPENPKDGNPF